ncbi:hypothetical protein [Alloprevotella sp. Lung230]|uniref:hypothetical protein n=1 Tax=Alloprevotella sp. Lung230 TaxID=2766595 RepID=UPI001CA462EB|nr:hypothetical protein [Alloprevotella sp. Lung230]
MKPSIKYSTRTAEKGEALKNSIFCTAGSSVSTESIIFVVKTERLRGDGVGRGGAVHEIKFISPTLQKQ